METWEKWTLISLGIAIVIGIAVWVILTYTGGDKHSCGDVTYDPDTQTCIHDKVCDNDKVCGTGSGAVCFDPDTQICINNQPCDNDKICGTGSDVVCFDPDTQTCLDSSLCDNNAVCGSDPDDQVCLDLTEYTCINGKSCDNDKSCGDTCCEDFGTMCYDESCITIICGNVTYDPDTQTCIDNQPCDNDKVCGTGSDAACFDPDTQTCINNQPCDNDKICGTGSDAACFDPDTQTCLDSGVCDNDAVCDDTCCGDGTGCYDGSCIPVCGDQICDPTGEICVDGECYTGYNCVDSVNCTPTKDSSPDYTTLEDCQSCGCNNPPSCCYQQETEDLCDPVGVKKGVLLISVYGLGNPTKTVESDYLAKTLVSDYAPPDENGHGSPWCSAYAISDGSKALSVYTWLYFTRSDTGSGFAATRGSLGSLSSYKIGIYSETNNKGYFETPSMRAWNCTSTETGCEEEIADPCSYFDTTLIEGSDDACPSIIIVPKYEIGKYCLPGQEFKYCDAGPYCSDTTVKSPSSECGGADWTGWTDRIRWNSAGVL